MRLPLDFRYLLAGNLELTAGTYSLFPVRQQFDQLRASLGKLWDIEHTNAGLHLFAQTVWYPVIGGSTATSGQTYQSQEGSYVNLGGVILAPFRAHLSAEGTVTGDAQLQGLPVTSADIVAPGIVYVPYWANWVNASTTFGGLVERSSTKATLYEDVGGGSGTSAIVDAGSIQNTSLLHGIVVYLAAT